MKKIIYAVSSTLVMIALFGTGCKNPPIFAAIEQEVKLKTSSVESSIQGITRVNNTLYVSNGNLYKKTLGETGTWENIQSGQCGSLATDGTNNRLYAVFGNKLQVLDNSGWKTVTTDGLGFVAGTDTVFATNGSGIYTVSGQTATHRAGISGHLKGAAGIYCVTTNGVYDGTTGTRVAGSPASGSAICKGAGNGVFVLSGGTLHAYDGSTWKSITHGVSEATGIAYLEDKKLVLISGSGGYGEVLLNGSTPMNLSLAARIAAGSTLSSIPPDCYQQYQNSAGKWRLDPIAAYKNGSGYIIYAGIHDPNTKYTGLWGFYNPGQREWNRE